MDLDCEFDGAVLEWESGTSFHLDGSVPRLWNKANILQIW
jgi:hypothetical protein